MINLDLAIKAANEWGPENDPDRRWFLAGWSDEEAWEPNKNCPSGNYQSNTSSWAAYNSGVIACRNCPALQPVIKSTLIQ